MLHQTLLFLGQLWQLFEVSQILEFLRYVRSLKGQSAMLLGTAVCNAIVAMGTNLWRHLALDSRRASYASSDLQVRNSYNGKFDFFEPIFFSQINLFFVLSVCLVGYY